MNYLYFLTRKENYDTVPSYYNHSYMSCVVVAKSIKKAKTICPDDIDYLLYDENGFYILLNDNKKDYCNRWPSPSKVKAKCLGIANKNIKTGVICSDFVGERKI